MKIEIKNKSETKADLYFYGDIVSDKWDKWTDEDKCPADITDILKECENISELNIYINSAGGNVWAGVAIYNIIKRFNAKKTVYIDCLAASIASVIALSGDTIIMPKNSYMMIHKAIICAQGNSNELRETADMLDKIEGSIVAVYEEHINDDISIDYIKELMAAETWLTAEEAHSLFKNVTVAEAVEAAACMTDYNYSHMPQNLKNRLKKEDNPPKEPKENVNNTAITLQDIKNFIYLEEEEQR